MEIPAEITFHNMQRLEDIEEEIRERIDRLEDFCDWITGCHVVVEAPTHQRKGGLYKVRIHLTVPPRRQISIDRGPHTHQEHADIHVAIRDAFSAARRQLRDFVREIRGETKYHEPIPHGRVAKLIDDAGYGFIEAPDGTEIYFDFNAVLGDNASRLTVGCSVRYLEEQGDDGLHATSVQMSGRHHSLEVK